MRERPIIFSGHMVRALLDGTKTQTRRVVSDGNSFGNYKASELDLARAWVDGGKLKAFLLPGANARQGFAPDEIIERLYPRIAPAHEWDQTPDPRDGYVPPASRLWVREKWCAGTPATRNGVGIIPRNEVRPGMKVVYAATSDYGADPPPWRPSIHMPRWASRLTLEITDVRVQRVQEISEEDAIAEGVKAYDGQFAGVYALGSAVSGTTARECFSRLWDSLNGKRGYSWDSNPFVWALTFRRVS